MAEQIPYNVAASLVNTLASAAFRELGRVYGVMDELESLKRTVESIKAVLLDAEERQEREHAVQLWITRLKDVLYPAEDVLDGFAIEDMRHNVNSGSKNRVKEVFHSLSPNRLAFRLKMAHKIEKIQKKFNDVVQEMSKLTLNPRTLVVEQTHSVRRETASFVLESNIIGREDSKRVIVSLLRQPNESLSISVVAIVGIGGLGKTALAQLVYNDVEVNNIFEKKMWVCVSDNFDVKAIVRNMLESLTKRRIDDKLSFDNLQNELRETLRGKKYLLVLDDTWNESLEKWSQFKTYLMCGAQNSKVLVTTRSKVVAQTMGVEVTHDLNGLNPEESWSLMKKIIFGDDCTRVSQALESMGEKIAQKCRGVPLAIRTLGGLLQGKNEESKWMNVLQGDFWKLCEDEDSIMPVLKLSYQDLSPQMRQCFAYCALYPKDWEIQKNELIELWMAQDYLQCSNEFQLVEDVGNQFVKTLLMKSFFQDVDMTEDGDIVSFKMHDLMHDLATQIAGNDCLCCLDGALKRAKGKPMHVWLGPDSDAISLLDSLDASRLRTLIIDRYYVFDKEVVLFISNFKHLRSLSLRSDISELPHSIGKLKHLRYLLLQLRKSKGLLSLPKSTRELVCLQTLRLSGDLQLDFCVNVSSKSINLRQLYIFYIHDSSVNYPKWISSFTNIIEVSLVESASVHYIPPLERLPFLKSLELVELNKLEYIYLEDDFSCGTHTFFPSLERLSLKFCPLLGWCRMGDNFDEALSLPSFPRLEYCEKLICMPTFPNLDKSLTLFGCPQNPLEATLNIAASSVDFTPLSSLKFLSVSGQLLKDLRVNWMKNLTSLQHLCLEHFSGQAFQEMETLFKDVLHWFPSLKKIDICHSRDLEALPEWMCNLSSLQHIKVVSCMDLLSLPEAMPRLTNLKTLEIIECPRLIEECKNEASHKIAHIPNIILQESYEPEWESTIWAETADNARSAARIYVLGGLSDKHHGMSSFWVSDRINEIDSEALRILNLCYERAKEILHQNKTLMDAVVNELVEKKSLTKQEFFRLVELHACMPATNSS